MSKPAVLSGSAMCDLCADPTAREAIRRRQVLIGLGAVPLLGLQQRAGRATVRTTAPSAPPAMVRRAVWGGDLPARGPLEAEDVRFLLVHHTYQPGSDYEQSDVVDLLRSTYAFHTGPAKQWPDIAYNFFVDKFGTIYEGRTGSFDRPVRGSATGGNQGFSQLCCFIGDFTRTPPPEPALQSMYQLLAWLADRYGINTAPGATTTFVSRGSNRLAEGERVTLPTIAGHRDVSLTECPGTACYSLVRSAFPGIVSKMRSEPAPPTTPTPSTSVVPVASSTAPASTSTSSTTPSTTPGSTTAVPATSSSRPGPRPEEAGRRGERATDRPSTTTNEAAGLVVLAASTAAAAVGAVVLRRRADIAPQAPRPPRPD